MRFIVFSLVVLSVTSASHAYITFQKLIPNGDKVRHPCLPFQTWPGVGHTTPQGGGARNVFGDAFKNAGYQWSTALCNLDSDGDGRSNGEELGDPNCVWKEGDTPSRTTRITHPDGKP